MGQGIRLPSLQNTTVVVASIILTLLALETVARIYVSIRWTEQEVAGLTQDFNARSGYISDPETGYRLEPGRSRTDNQGRVFTHNSTGFRGPDTIEVKPGNTYRIILMGASTVYGPYVDDRETSAAQLQELLASERPHQTIEVINAGVPG